MYKNSKLVFFSILFMGAQTVCGQSFLPENFRQIPVEQKNNDINEELFNQIVQEAQKLYEPIIADLGGDFFIYKAWSSATVNAYADRSDDGRKWNVSLNGGIARHPQMTPDGLRLTLCHEIGHHLGGAPKKSGNTWSTVEGGADYFSTLKCLRKWWNKSDLVSWRKSTQVPPLVESECQKNHLKIHDQLNCMRASLAGLSVAWVMKDIEWESLEPSFDTPDESVPRSTLMGHPTPQCRLDTYFQGSLCPVSDEDSLDDQNPQLGACLGTITGQRPRCWFDPEFF